jgi:hypothetical protein
MGNTYNIYRIKNDKYVDLLNKIESVGLVKQKTQNYDNYEMTFFSQKKLKEMRFGGLKLIKTFKFAR